MDIYFYLYSVGEVEDEWIFKFILVIFVDNLYDMNYRVGCFGLVYVIDVEYNLFNDGDWWCCWWENNCFCYLVVVYLVILMLFIIIYGENYDVFFKVFEMFDGFMSWIMNGCFGIY